MINNLLEGEMDYDDFRTVLDSSGVDVWTYIDTAIAVAASDCGDELRQRRDGIVERLYSMTTVLPRSQNCDSYRHYDREVKPYVEQERVSPPTPESVGRENEDVEELDPYAGLFDDERKKILEIKELLEVLDQSEDSLVELLQSLADMDITFQALKETDIGRDVNRLRKHSSNEIRLLVKQLVRKWKEIVDEWVKINQPGERGPSGLMGDGDSPQQKINQNAHHQVPNFAYSPNPHSGSSGSDGNNLEPERKPKVIPSQREAPPKPRTQSVPSSVPQNRHREQKEQKLHSDRLASASKRLQESYKEAENAKKQRTIQVMDIHEIPKPKNKNVFFGKNKGGAGRGGSQGRHW